MPDISFIVESGYNTSYIDSLCMCLFYKSSCIDVLLNHNPDDSRFYYLQMLIKNNLINATRREYSIGSDILNEIRNFCVICDFNSSDITFLCDVSEFYVFLLNGIGIGKIHMETVNLNDMSHTKSFESDNGTPTISHNSFNYIEFIPTENDYLLNTDVIVERWKNKNIGDKRYHFIDMPFVLPIYNIVLKLQNLFLVFYTININKFITIFYSTKTSKSYAFNNLF